MNIGLIFLHLDEFLDVHRLRGFDIHPREVVIVEHDELSFLILIAAHDVLPWHFLPIGLGRALVIDRAKVALAEKLKAQFLTSRRG